MTDDEVYVGYFRAIVLDRPDVPQGEKIEVTCPYCGATAEYINGFKFFICGVCDQRTTVFKTGELLEDAKEYLEECERKDALDDD